VFPAGRRHALAKLDLGEGSALYVGSDGLRELVKADGPPLDAPTPALLDFGGILKTKDAKFAFVTFEGDVHLGADPLGVLEPHKGPLSIAGARAEQKMRCGIGDYALCRVQESHGRFPWITTGRAAILGVTDDGRVLRTVDYGASWHEVAYAGPKKPYGRPASIELDPQGNGLLLHFPQRVYVTHDDGATWSELPSPGIGAWQIARDGADRLWLGGWDEKARLEGASLKVNHTEDLAPIAPPSRGLSEEKDGSTRKNAFTIFTGDRTVELAELVRKGKVREVEIRSAPLGGEPSHPVAHKALVGRSGMSRLVAGFGAEVVYLREDDGDPTAPTTTVLRSTDYGATWREERKLEGAGLMVAVGVHVAVGPGGWTFVTALCADRSPRQRNCAHYQVRPAGASAFEDMQFDEEFLPFAFTFDLEHDRVYALGVHDSIAYVYESPLSLNHFTRLEFVKLRPHVETVITVDSEGTLRMLAPEDNKGVWALYRRKASGEALPVLYVPLPRPEGALAFAGSRGLMLPGREHGWETADGGETWTRVDATAVQHLTCSDAGCVDGEGAERIGWDLPAVHGETVTASPEPPTPDAAPRPSAAPPAIRPIELVCKPAGRPGTIEEWPMLTEIVDSGSSDARWAVFHRNPDGKRSVVFGAQNQVREALLLAPTPKVKPGPGKATTSFNETEDRFDDGFVAARFRRTTDADGKVEPANLELAWWSTKTMQAHHYELKKAAHAHPHASSGTPRIVDGGLLFEISGGTEVFFVHDDGKVETLSIPSGTSVRNAERVGTEWLLAERNDGNIRLYRSKDGKAWTRTGWGLDTGGIALLGMIDDKPTVNLSRAGFPSLLFAVGSTPANDPPAPVVVDPKPIAVACDAHASSRREKSNMASGERLLVRVEMKDAGLHASTFTALERVTHTSATGAICTSAYILGGRDANNTESQTAFVYPTKKGHSGWWFPSAPDPHNASKRVTLATPLTCEPASQ
jgi:hypothetical protein